VENRLQGEATVETLVVWSNDAVQTVPVDQLNGMQFVDTAVQKKLESGLLGMMRDESARHDGLSLEFAGEGKRDVQFSYVVDAPVWRMTWRMEIGGEQVSLQGWAHVDNDSGSDWKEVAMELRSGRPFLFHADVFQPLMTVRPDYGTSLFEIPRDTRAMNLSLVVSNSQRMVDEEYDWTDTGLGGSGGGIGGRVAGGEAGGSMGGGMPGGSFGVDRDGFATSVDPRMESSTRNTVDAENWSEAIAQASYQSQTVVLTVNEPVSIPAGNSAMVPVFKEQTQGEEKTWLEMTLNDFSGKAELLPVRAMKISGLESNRLVGGPVAVFRNGSFAGDCALSRPALGEPLVLQFGTDADVKVTSRSSKETSVVASVQRKDGKNQVTRKMTKVNTIVLANSGSEGNNMELKISGLADWNLVGEEMMLENGSLVGRFDIAPAKSLERTFTLSKEVVNEMPVAAVAVLKELQSEGFDIDPAVAELVKEHLELTGKIDALRERTSPLTTEMNELLKEQGRLSRQLLSTKEETDLGRVYSVKLLAGEERLTELRKLVDGQNAERTALETTRTELDKR